MDGQGQVSTDFNHIMFVLNYGLHNSLPFTPQKNIKLV